MPCPCGRALLGGMIYQVPIGHYNFYLIHPPWKATTNAPEAHRAQVHPDLDLGSKKVTTPLNWGLLAAFVL